MFANFKDAKLENILGSPMSSEMKLLSNAEMFPASTSSLVRKPEGLGCQGSEVKKLTAME